MRPVTYDTGALIAAERGDRRMWRLHESYTGQGLVPRVPAAVLAEAWRGGPRQARLSRLLTDCEVVPMTESHARHVGRLLGQARFQDIVDASVVVHAVERGSVVVTSNFSHIRRLAEAARAPLEIVAV